MKSYFCVIYITGSSGSGKKSSNTGIVVGAAVGGCVLVVLLIVAGMYAFRQKGRAERATHESRPFGMIYHYPLRLSFFYTDITI